MKKSVIGLGLGLIDDGRDVTCILQRINLDGHDYNNCSTNDSGRTGCADGHQWQQNKVLFVNRFTRFICRDRKWWYEG